MLDSVGQTPMQNFGRPETTVVAQEKKVLIDKEQKVKENRPVESTQEGAEAKEKQKAMENRPAGPTQESAEAKRKSAIEKEEETRKTSAHTFEEGRVVYEKYNNNGDVILRLPPAKNPVDELV